MNNNDIEKKQITKAVSKPVQNLLLVTIVINRDTGKVLDIVSKPSICNNNLTVDKNVENRLSYLEDRLNEIAPTLT